MTTSEIMAYVTFACLQAALWNQCKNGPHCPVVHSGVAWVVPPRNAEWI